MIRIDTGGFIVQITIIKTITIIFDDIPQQAREVAVEKRVGKYLSKGGFI